MINKIKYDGRVVVDTFKDGRCRIYRLCDDATVTNSDLKRISFSIYCSECGKEFQTNNIKSHYLLKKYICNSCNRRGEKNPFYGKKHSDEFKKRLSSERSGTWGVGVDNAMFGTSNYEVWVDKFGVEKANELQNKSNRKNSISNKGVKNHFYGKHHSQESKDKISKANNEYRKAHPETIERQRQLMMDMISSGKMFKKNKIERKTEEWLNDNNIDYRYNFILDGRYQYDFRILGTNYIVEVQGDFWHGNPDIYSESDLSERQLFKKQRDDEKLDYANEKGYNILYIWESEINNDDFSSLEVLNEKI